MAAPALTGGLFTAGQAFSKVDIRIGALRSQEVSHAKVSNMRITNVVARALPKDRAWPCRESHDGIPRSHSSAPKRYRPQESATFQGWN